MRVVFTDPRPSFKARFKDANPYQKSIEAVGAECVSLDLKTESETVDACRDATVIVSFKSPISRKVIENTKDCRLIMRNGTGYDNVDLNAATEHGIPVSNVPGYSSEEVASHAIALMLAAANDIVFCDKRMRSSNGWGVRTHLVPMYGGTFGIVGLGRVGRAVVPKARGFDMKVIAYDPYLPQDLFAKLNVENVSFDEMLDRSDCVSIHCILSAETYHLFSTDEFKRMKETAVLVNTARGGIVDDLALASAVEEGEIYAAGLDVFESEPPANSPVFKSDRIICSPHHAGRSHRSDERCIEIGTAEILRALRGEHLLNVVNPEVFQRGDTLINPERRFWEG